MYNNTGYLTGNETGLGGDGGEGPGFVPILPFPIKIGFYALYAVVAITGKKSDFLFDDFMNANYTSV